MNLTGVCSNSKAVVAYADEFTNILISTDKGETWNQKMILNIFHNINLLKVYNDTFYGIADSSIIVQSYDGLNWSKYYPSIGVKFVDISVDTNFIYLLSAERNKLFKLDKDIQLFDSLQISSYITEIFSYENHTF